MWWWCVVAATAAALGATAPTSGRAVNMSNAWILPQEGFPVFYRYFRDRISWYEADAVCQFHHANLVTVDTTAQYDAMRAFLKELDISSGVWLGLIRSAAGAEFTWTDYRALSSEGYWSSPPTGALSPLCAAADPAADYRWTALGCGGPSVASFVCELPVPTWALGADGCMVAALPALTAAYLPEHGAVQLSADCGLAGVNSVLCLPDQNHRDLVKNLSCGEVETDERSDTSRRPPAAASIDTRIPARHTDAGILAATANAAAGDGNLGSRNALLAPTALKAAFILNDNLQSNDIPQLVRDDEMRVARPRVELVDDAHTQSKRLHEEMASHGDFETIFTQPTDRFVPPLVMAKAKIGDDMKVLSPDEKYAQRAAERRGLEPEPRTPPSVTAHKPGYGLPSPLMITSAVERDDEADADKNVLRKSSKSSVPKKYNTKKYEKKVIAKPMPLSGRRDWQTVADSTLPPPEYTSRSTHDLATFVTESPRTETDYVSLYTIDGIHAIATTRADLEDGTQPHELPYSITTSASLAVASSTAREIYATLPVTALPIGREPTQRVDSSETGAAAAVGAVSSGTPTALASNTPTAGVIEDSPITSTSESLSLEVAVWEDREGTVRRPTRSRRLQELAAHSARKFNPFRILG